MSTAFWSQPLNRLSRRLKCTTRSNAHSSGSSLTESAPPDTSNDEAIAWTLHSLLNGDIDNRTTSTNRAYPGAPSRCDTSMSFPTTAGWHRGQSPYLASVPMSIRPSQLSNSSQSWSMTGTSPSGITCHDALPDYLFEGNEAKQTLKAISHPPDLLSQTDSLRDTAVNSSPKFASTAKIWPETGSRAGSSIPPPRPPESSSGPALERVRRTL